MEVKTISRDNYRHLIKHLTREQFSVKLYHYYTQAYNEGVNDTEASIYRRLYDDFGFTDDMIKQLREGVGNDIDAINLKLITATEIFEGLINEGLTSLQEKGKMK